MDVIGRDNLPTESKASATKLTNGNANLLEDNATATAFTGGAGRRKTKRKNKAKNSQREDAESELKIEASATRVTTTELHSAVTVTSPKAVTKTDEAPSRKQVDGENVNSNDSSIGSSYSHRSSHSNGLPTDDTLALSVDAISMQLEHCVQICRNGLSNGLPKLFDKSSDGSPPEKERSQPDGLMHDKEFKAKSARKKHRNRQAKKAQAANTSCTVNGDEQGDGEVEEEEDKGGELGRSGQESTVFPDQTNPENKTSALPSGNNNVKKIDQDKKMIPSECYSHGRTEHDLVSPSATTVSTSSLALPDSAHSAIETVDNNVSSNSRTSPVQITYQVYESERQMPAIMSLIQKDLSEPYSIYTYRYFIHNWPKLCFLALHDDTCVGAIVCKLDIHRQDIRRGYIAMLAVDKDYRKLKIGTTLVQKAIQVMLKDNADEVVLETEITNQPALRLYENLGFVRDKRLFHYYLNGVDALRLKLWFR